jgi:hypothetical protein
VNRPRVVRRPRISELTIKYAADGQPESMMLIRIDGSAENSSGIEQYRGKASNSGRIFLCHRASFGSDLLITVASAEEEGSVV